jgi:hypothetical protein
MKEKYTMYNGIALWHKKLKDVKESGSQASSRSGSPEKLQQLRGEHMRFIPDGGRPTDRQATSDAQKETAYNAKQHINDKELLYDIKQLYEEQIKIYFL